VGRWPLGSTIDYAQREAFLYCVYASGEIPLVSFMSFHAYVGPFLFCYFEPGSGFTVLLHHCSFYVFAHDIKYT